MTQQEIRDMATRIVGDGCPENAPNLFFVTQGPYYKEVGEYDSMDSVLDGFDEESDVTTYGPLSTYDEALEKYNEIDLDPDYGVGQVFIEDRLSGTIAEKWLTARKGIVWDTDEYIFKKRR
jgi:hypothetical protein